jgi:hypothetical protein
MHPTRTRLGARLVAATTCALVVPMIVTTTHQAQASDDEEQSKATNTPVQRAKIAAARRDRPEPPDRCPYSAAEYPRPALTKACLRHNGTGRTVLVVGDSHAEHWVPALYRAALARNWRLLSLTRAKCNPLNFIAVRDTDRGHPTVGETCNNWKQTAYPTVIKHADPGLVLFGGRSQVYDIRVGGRIIRQESSDYFSTWRHSWRWTVKTLTARGARVGALTLQPTMRAKVPDCLARNGFTTKVCDLPIRKDLRTRRANAFVKHIHAIYPRVRPVPVNNLVCPAGRCKAVLEGIITHADQSHLTAHWSRSKSRAVVSMLLGKNLL